jgi:hypothetical protein
MLKRMMTVLMAAALAGGLSVADAQARGGGGGDMAAGVADMAEVLAEAMEEASVEVTSGAWVEVLVEAVSAAWVEGSAQAEAI